MRTGEGEAVEPGASAPVAVSGSADALDQTLTIRAVRDVSVRVVVDGEVAFDGKIPAKDADGKPYRMPPFQARDRIEVEVPSVESVKMAWNGEAVVPQGRQDVPRRLVFIDDVGPHR